MIDQSVQHPPRILLLSVFRKWVKWERGFLRVDAKMIWRLRVVCNVTWIVTFSFILQVQDGGVHWNQPRKHAKNGWLDLTSAGS
jgi:hypothetical protein